MKNNMEMPGAFAKKSCSGCGNSSCKDHTPPPQNSKDPTLVSDREVESLIKELDKFTNLPLPEVKRKPVIRRFL